MQHISNKTPSKQWAAKRPHRKEEHVILSLCTVLTCNMFHVTLHPWNHNKTKRGRKNCFCSAGRQKGLATHGVTLHKFCRCVTPKRSTFRNIQITQLATSAQDYKRPCQENVLEMQPSKTRVTPGWVILWKERKIGLLIIARQCCNNKTFQSPNTPRPQRQTVAAKEDAKIWINLCWDF